jgi:drug/metabolite transporter (DMT)-like permease
VLGVTGHVRIDPIGVMWGLLAAVGLAIYFLLSARTGQAPRGTGVSQAPPEPLPPIAMTWAAMCTGGAALLLLGWTGLVPLTVRTGPVTVLNHQVSWVLPVIGLALISSVIPYTAGIGAARRLGAKLASFAGLAEVLFAILFAWLLLGQLPTGMQILGGAFILAGVALVRLDELHAPDQSPAEIDGGEPVWVPDQSSTAQSSTAQSSPSRSAQASSSSSE